MPLPRLIPVKSPSGQRTAELSGFCWSLCPKKRKWWIISGYAYCPRLFTRLVITRFWRIEQYPLQNFSDVCALIRNIFVTMSDARFAKCADSADAPEVSFALLSTFLLCINAGEDKEALIPFFFSFPRSASLSDDQSRYQRRDGKKWHAILLFSCLELAQGQSIVMPALYKLFINFCPCLLLL